MQTIFILFIFLFPVTLTIGIVTIPVVRNYANHDLAEKATMQTRRWFWGHLLSAAAFGVGLLALFSISLFLYEQDVVLWPTLSLLFAAIGAALLAFGMGADGIGPLAVSKQGHPARVFFDGSRYWVMLSFISGSVIFGLGQIFMVVGFNHLDLLSTATGVIILIAAILFSMCAAIPSGWGLYALAFCAWIVYVPIGIAVW